MSIPNYQECMLPLLEIVGDGKHYQIKAVTQRIADRFSLTEEERTELLPSKAQAIIANRVAWAKTYLKKAGLLEQPKRGVVAISSEGMAVLKNKPTKLDTGFLERYPAFHEFKTLKHSETTSTADAELDVATPEETFEESYLTLRKALADELLDRIKACSPEFFERLVVELLVAMGYGGTLADAGQAIGKTGDGGIDGIIKEDKLGLDVVCIQAKRWEGTVGRPEVQSFAGSMEAHRAKKGVLFTTSTFSKDANDYVRMIERKIVLIDKQLLTELMIDHGIGVVVDRTYVLNKVDSDYFDDQE
jgi:restriction system protein